MIKRGMPREERAGEQSIKRCVFLIIACVRVLGTSFLQQCVTAIPYNSINI